MLSSHTVMYCIFISLYAYAIAYDKRKLNINVLQENFPFLVMISWAILQSQKGIGINLTVFPSSAVLLILHKLLLFLRNGMPKRVFKPPSVLLSAYYSVLNSVLHMNLTSRKSSLLSLIQYT